MSLEILSNKNDFLVIGLVGAVGCRLKSLSNILSSILKSEFEYEVVEIHVSQKFLLKHVKNKFDSQYERYNCLMNIGNELRKKYDSKYLAFKIAEDISILRRENIEQKRKAYIINSLKHEDEIKTLRNIYGKNFY